MARLPRLAVAGLPHLVLLRGHDGQPVVRDDDDRRHLLAALHEAAALQRLAVHAYALLDDRLLLLATPPQVETLSRVVQDLGRRYVGAFNRRHGRAGTLWDGRFRATVLQPERHALDALLFVDGAVPEAADPSWCSAPHHLGRRRDPLVTDASAYWQLGNTPFERETRYATLLAEGLSASRVQQLAEACAKGWALGDAAFLDGLAQRTARPLRPRPRGRPPKATPPAAPDTDA